MSEETVLTYLRDTNRPWNITNVTVRRRSARPRRLLRGCSARSGQASRLSLAEVALFCAWQDALQSTGLKKAQIQRALDTLAESGRCLCTARACLLLGALLRRDAAALRAGVARQENGKQKIYLTLQDQAEVPPEARRPAASFRPKARGSGSGSSDGRAQRHAAPTRATAHHAAYAAPARAHELRRAQICAL
jgi:hypothetical protein